MQLDQEQQYSYNRYLDYLHFKASEALSIKEESDIKLLMDVAKNAINKGLDDNTIADITGLDLEEIQVIRLNLKKK